MDEHISPFSFSQSSLLSFSSAPSSSTTLPVFPSSDVSEQWFFPDTTGVPNTRNDDDVTNLMHKPEYTTLSHDTEHPRILPGHPAMAQPLPKRPIGRKSASSRHATNHVENERQRREKMNRCFCQLRAAVPTVSRMDKTSLLADATSYIHQLRARMAQLEAQARQQEAGAGAAAASHAAAAAGEETVEVRMVGTEAAVVRVVAVAAAQQHAPASLMAALRCLQLQVRHACISRGHGVITQDVVVDVPPGASALHDGNGLRTALLEKMQGSE